MSSTFHDSSFVRNRKMASFQAPPVAIRGCAATGATRHVPLHPIMVLRHHVPVERQDERPPYSKRWTLAPIPSVGHCPGGNTIMGKTVKRLHPVSLEPNLCRTARTASLCCTVSSFCSVWISEILHFLCCLALCCAGEGGGRRGGQERLQFSLRFHRSSTIVHREYTHVGAWW